MKFKNLVFVALPMSVLFVATNAFAQVAPVAPGAVTISPYVVVTTLLTVVLGFINQGINSGTILQNISLPKSWLPWLTILGSFLMTATASLVNSEALTSATVLAACMAGALGLAGAGGGAALQFHSMAHKDFAKKAAAAAAKAAAVVGLIFFANTTACTAAQATAFDQAIATGNAALVPAENLSCTAATILDPTGATAICSVIDASGAAIGTTFTVVESVQAIAALIAKVPALSPTVAAKLSAFEQSLVVKGVKKP
jgi:hypothetical protein